MAVVYSLAELGGTPEVLPTPAAVDRADVRIGGEQTTLDGSTMRTTIAVKTTWSLRWSLLSTAQLDTVRAWGRGDRGLGPFELREGDAEPVLANVDPVAASILLDGWWTDITLTLREV